MSLGWPVSGWAPLLFVGFVPLLFIEDHIYNSLGKYRPISVFNYSYITFFLWNLLTTWWIYHSSLGGAILAIVFNSLFMAIIFTSFHIVKKRLKATNGYFILFCFWMGFELLHLQWDLTWPWLTLGNGFASYYKWIQWYEYTGAFGGTLWILAANVLIFLIIKKRFLLKQPFRTQLRLVGGAVLLIVIPILVSYLIYGNYTEKPDPVNVVVVQPNIDPYNEKFGGLTHEEQLSKMLNLVAEKADSSTEYIVCPETAVTESIWENNIEQNFSLGMIRTFIAKLPKTNFVTGISSYKAFQDGEKPTATARKFYDAQAYFDAYNTAMQVDQSPNVQLYHKSKLVPGVERMPFPAVFKPLEQFAIDLGGTTGSLATQDERIVFTSVDKKRKVAPVICYESVYGEFVGDYIRNGAELIFIITNDGWWENTPGYKQHLHYGRLRAIETRRSIARSANTGISCFINQKGDISQPTEWWVPAVIKGTINANQEKTFYTKFGDYIGKAFATSAILLLVYSIIFPYISRSSLSDKAKISV